MNELPATRRVLEDGIAQGLHLGAQICVRQRGAVLAELALGEARPGEPMTVDHAVFWASSGKPLTAVAIAQLVEKRALDWDTPVASVIPEFARNEKDAITIRHLLTHTAGFRAADKLPELLPWDEAVDAICSAPREENWTPGEKAGYQLASSWIILGEIIRRSTGRPPCVHLRRALIEPAGMQQTWPGLPTPHPLFAPIYITTGAPVTHPVWETRDGWTICRPGANTRGPIRDLARFYELLLNGGAAGASQIVQPATLKQMTARQRDGLYDHTFLHTLDFGFGFIINSRRYGPETVPYGYGPFASEDAFGHSGSQSSCAFADPARDLAIAWACNGMPGERRHQARARQINAAIYQDLGLAA